MKTIIEPTLTFTPASRTLDFSAYGAFDLKKLYAVINIDKQTLIYAVASAGLGYSSVSGGNVLTLQYDTTSMGSSDRLQIIYDDSSAVQAVSAASLPLPAGASTSANQSTGNTSLSSIDTKLSSQATAAKQDTGNTSLASIDGKTPALGQALAGASVPVVLPAAQISTLTPLSTIAATQSGTWNVNNVSGTVSLPTGAATAANQTSANTSLTSIDGKIPAKGQALMSASTPVTLASDQSSIPTKAPVNSTGSGSAAGATVSTVVTLSAPSNAVGFILQNLDTSTLNIRWAIGRTATATLGQQLQPGRDTGFVPCGANVSIVAESGTQNYDIQWISQ